jgi:hypothetical protein
MTTRIDIQLAPKRHVTDGMRKRIAASFALADLPEPRWVPMRGDRSDSHPKVPIAPPHLVVRLTPTDGAHPADVVRGVATRLTPVLAAIRRELPDLPMGLEVCSPDQVTHYGFRPTDTPDAIQRALAACPTASELDKLGPSIGWDTIRWVSLNDQIAVTRRR